MYKDVKHDKHTSIQTEGNDHCITSDPVTSAPAEKSSRYIDSKQSYSAVTSTNVIEDKRALIDVCALRQMLEKGELKSVQWIRKEKQLADPLTKGTASSDLLIGVLSGEVDFPL